jgi:hypothetical protein
MNTFTGYHNADSRQLIREMCAAEPGVRLVCLDPRHDEPCFHSDPHDGECTACMSECNTDYWFNPDGSPWGGPHGMREVQ